MINRLEEYLGILPNGTRIATITSAADDSDGDSGALTDVTEHSILFEPFKDLCKRRFLWYYESYLLSINKAKSEVVDGESFVRMPFECVGNVMDGKFNYKELETRIKRIRKALDEETAKWAEDGMLLWKKESGVACNLQRQFEQAVEHYKQNQAVTLDIDLVDKNPFVWVITYFGRPMTNLDGGLFRITINISPRFPEEQPRAKFETPLFHHRIAPDGTPCYFPKRVDDIRSHIEALIEALEEESPPYDPRTTVNPEASKLYWGSADDRKTYNRKLRRAVQRSME